MNGWCQGWVMKWKYLQSGEKNIIEEEIEEHKKCLLSLFFFTKHKLND